MIARQPDRYVHGLWLYRDGQLDPWVTWFAEVCEDAAGNVVELTAAIANLQSRWQVELSDLRSHGTARRLLAELAATPVISVDRTVATLRVSDRSARSALGILEEGGILEPLEPIPQGPGRPRKMWVAGDLVDLL